MNRPMYVFCVRCGDEYRILFDSTPRIGEEEVAQTKIDVERFIAYCRERGFVT